jgi:hypothetical protein
MATYDAQLLTEARRLVARRAGQKGKLPQARVRRSISTTYYALFHFLVEEATRGLIGTKNDRRRRRRVLARSFTHSGMKTALEKVRKDQVDPNFSDFFRPGAQQGGPVDSPAFVRTIATAFPDAQAKRHDADYDLNAPLSEQDAVFLASRVERAILQWRQATTAADKEFKQALCLLMLLRGRLKPGD